MVDGVAVTLVDGYVPGGQQQLLLVLVITVLAIVL